MRRPTLRGEMQGEILGSFLLVFFGTGAVAVAVLTGAHQGLWEVATVWGFAIGLAIYAVGAVSGAHLNPAVTLAMAVFRRDEFPWRKVAPYVGAQMVGGVLASALLLGMFGATCSHFEAVRGIVRGAPGSQLSAMWFGEYFPNPAVYGTDGVAFAQVGVLGGFIGEMVGTALLLFFIMALTDKCNKLTPIEANFHPILIGLVVAVIISIVAPLTQAGLNPMRDFAPRLVSYFAGWGAIAIPGPRGCEWWLYILAPLVGGLLGALVYETVIHPHQTGERVAAGEDRSACSLYQCAAGEDE
jgi:glycerol uptake facilitator protein